MVANLDGVMTARLSLFGMASPSRLGRVFCFSRQVWSVVIACLSVFAAAGCRPRADVGLLTEAPWRVVDVEIAGPKAPGVESGEREAIDGTAGAYFRFYPDGVATFVLKSRFHAGRWTLDEANSEVQIELPGGVTRAFRVTSGWDGFLRLSEPTGGRPVAMVAEPDVYDYGDHDLYSESMNLWRTALPDVVTDEVLRTRLQAMVRYLAAYFEAAAAQDLKTVNVSALSTPFIFASNGLGLRQEEALPTEWVVLFPEREDCRRMSRLIASLFKDVSPPATKNRFRQYASMFRQMEQRLSALSRPVGVSPATPGS